MKNLCIAITSLMWLFLVACNDENNANKQIKIEINKNVELLGFVYFLGFEGPSIENNPGTVEINGVTMPKKEWHAYGYDFYEKYKAHSRSQNLVEAFTNASHLWLDYLINLLVQLEDFPNASLSENIEESYYLQFSQHHNPDEAKKKASAFIEALNRFHDEVDFETFLLESQDYYANVGNQIREKLPDAAFVSTMERFYKQEFDSYSLIPSLTVPKGMGFGLKYSIDGKTKVYNVFGALDKQSFQDRSQLDMGFGDENGLRELSTHEFAHSFVNHVVDQIPRVLISATSVLFEPIKAKMSEQAYNTWEVCLYEHFVRAGEVAIAEIMGDYVAAEALKRRYIESRKFVYLPIFLEELDRYRSNKKMPYLDFVNNAMERLRRVVEG